VFIMCFWRFEALSHFCLSFTRASDVTIHQPFNIDFETVVAYFDSKAQWTPLVLDLSSHTTLQDP